MPKRRNRPTARPANDYTPRVIPHHPAVAVPLEATQILWQRLSFADFAPLLFISARHGSGVGELIETVRKSGRTQIITLTPQTSKSDQFQIQVRERGTGPMAVGVDRAQRRVRRDRRQRDDRTVAAIRCCRRSRSPP